VDGRSHLVSLLKAVLPLSALALLSTLFLLSRGTETDGVIPFANRDLDDRLKDQQVTNPFFSGITDSGHEIIVSAIGIRQTSDEDTQADAFLGRLRNADGQEIRIRANTGQLDLSAEQLVFSGDVMIEDATGLVLHTALLRAALNDINGDSPGPVTGSGPIGTFTAGSMTITSPDGVALRLLFKNGVNLLYLPKR